MSSDFERVEKSDVGKRLRSDPGITSWGFACISCPVMIELVLDGFPATFYARDAGWTFTVGIPGATNESANVEEQILNIGARYDDIPAAGYMDLEEAYLFIEQGVAFFRQVRSLSPSTFGEPQPSKTD